MRIGPLSLGSVGAPCGACGTGAALLIATDITTSAALNENLTWYLLIAGAAYAGRLPIHLFGIGYFVLHPDRYEQPKLRRRLNFLTCLNAVSIVAWFAAAWFLLSQPQPALWLEAVVGVVFYGLVMLLGMATVECATELGLPRGTEYVCDSWLGKQFKKLRKRAPDGSALEDGMDFFTQKTPPHQASWFLALVAAAFLALPSAVSAGKGAEQALHKEDPAAKVAEGNAGVSGQGDASGGMTSDPTYEDECEGAVVPGAPAPPTRREELKILWLGGGGIDGDGAIEAGCARPATPVPGHPEVWVARGYCGSSLRALGVSAPNYLPALLYQQAAEFALEKVRAKELRGASSRWQVGKGDGYVIDTDEGSYVLARQDASGGEAESSGDLPCEKFEEANEPYVVVPPGLLSLWSEIGQDRWVWPVPDPDHPDEFAFLDEEGNEINRAHCYSDSRCAAWIDDTLRPTTGSLFTSASVLLNMAE